MANETVLLRSASRRDVLGDLQCYARSVVGPDWQAQASSRALSPITDVAADRITAALARAKSDARNADVIGSILSNNQQRIQARIERVDEGRPSVPVLVWALMLVTVVISLAGTAAFGHPGVRRRTQVVVLASTTVVFAFTLLVIDELDRPYDGPTSIRPTAMLNVERRMASLPDGNAGLPCDDQGRLAASR